MTRDPIPPTPRRGLKARVVARVQTSERTGGLPRDFWFVWVGMLINRAGTFVLPFLALYVTNGRGHSPAVAASVLLAFGLGGLPSQPLGGAMADRFGRIPTAATGLFASSVALVGMAVAESPVQLVVAAAFLGLVADIYRPATSALIADIIPTKDRPRAFGLGFWAVNLGFAAAAVVGGLLAEVSWTWLFIGDAITTALYGLVLLRFVSEPDRSATTSGPGLRGGLAIIRRDRLFLAFLVVAVTYATMYSQVQSTLPLELGTHGLDESDYGSIIALNGLLIVLIQPLVIARVSTWRPGIALAGAQVVLGIGLGLTAFATDIPTFAATVLVWTLGEIVGSTFAAPIVADLSPPEMRGRYQGVFGMSFSVAFAIGPAGGVRLFGAAGGSAVWGACAVAGLASALLTLRLRDGIVARREAAAAAEAASAMTSSPDQRDRATAPA